MNTDNIFIAQVDKSERARSEPYITFWVQKNPKYASTLETLFRGEYGNILDNTPPVNPRQLNVQTIWCVRSARHGWCRAQILSLDNSYGGYVAAYMTDYGNTEMVSFDQIRSVDALGASSDSLVKLTHLAVKCVLADITPASPEGWCDAALNYVYESFVGHSVPAQNLGPCGNATAMRVFLGNGEYFVKNLIEVGWALPAPSHNAPPTNPYTSLPAPSQFSYQQNQNHPNKQQIAPSYPNLNLAPPAAEPAPASTPRDYYISGELRFNTDYEVYITVVEQGPNKFSLQDRDSEPQLELIRQLMSQASLRPLTGNIERGTHCIARFSEDGQLYRGLVTIPSPDACQVYYVDYGNKEYVARDRLYQSFPELLEMPVCAIRCSLFGLESLENLPLLNETFQTLVSTKLLKCRLRNRDRMHVVELFEGERSILDVLRDTCAAAAPSKKQFGMFQTLDFPVGAQESVTVCYLEDLDDFYVQLKNYEDDLNVLQKLINSPNTHRTLQPMTDVLQRKGSPCLALFPEDEQWYRGIVTDVSPEMKRVKVQFVDYGNVAEIDARSVKVLNEHLLNLMPAQALRCSLSGLEKAKIPESVRDEFSQLLETDSAYPATVKKINTKHHVELKDLTSEQSINQQILDKISGKVSTVAAAPVKVPIPVPELTEVEKVYVTATGKPGFFHAQLERLPTELLDTLQLELLGVYGKAAANAPLLYADVCPHVNDFGVVQWSHDSAFYRVKILDEFVSDVEVVFVDYGNRLKVNRRAVLSPLTSLKKWTLPMFGIACQVNVNPTLDPAVWSGLEDQSLEVRILRRNGDIFQVVPTPNPCNALLERCVTVSGISPVKPASSPVKPLNGWNGSSSVPERSSNRSNSDWQSSREEEQSAGRGAVRNHGRSNGNSNEWSQPTQASNDWVGNTSKPQNNDNGGWNQAASEDPWGSSASTTSNTHERSFPSNSRADSYKPRSEHCDRGERGGYQRGGRDGDSYGGRGGSRGGGRDGVSYGGRGGSRGGGRGGSRDRNPPPVPPVVYPRPAPILGQVKDVEVVFVTSPAEFYVQLQEAIPQLDALMAELASFYEESTHSKDLNNPQVGMPCACKFLDDEAWYRGSITNVDFDGAEILFVDYGNVQKTPLTDLKALERKFAVLPPQAYKCGLVNVTLTRSEEEKASFEELTWEKTLKAKFIRRLEAGGYGVRLRVTGEESSVINEAFGMPSTVGVPAPSTGFIPWYTPKENETNSVAIAWYDHAQQLFLSPPAMDDFEAQVMLPLAEFYVGLDDNELVESGLFVGQAVVAKYAEDQVYYRAVVKKADDHPEVCFVDYGNASTCTHADIKRILPKFLEHPQQTLACTLRGVVANSEAASDAEKALSEGIWNCTWYKEENGKFVVDLQSERGSLAQLLYEGGFVTPSASIVESLETDTSLTPVYVSHVKSPALFYLQSQAEEDALAALSDQLNEFCQANPQPLEESERAVGPDSILVAGKHPDDELWYRGKILSWDEDQQTAQVHFVDYGDTQSIPASNLCQISPELQAPPPYGLPCSLTSLLEPFIEDWTEEVTQRLHSLAGEGTVVCKALLCPPADGLTQILGLLAEDVNIIDTLLDEGLATLKTFPFAELPALTVECGQVIDSAFIGFVDNPNRFWVQFPHESFEQMAADLAIQGPHLPTIVPEIGTVCVAQYSVDEAWYRVLILRGASEDVATALVKFVDYGNTEELAQISLRALPSHYALIPSLAVETSLTTSDAAWLPEAQEAFAAMEGQEVRVSVLEDIQSGKFVVQLVDLETEEDVFNTLKAIQACREVSEDRVVPEAIEEVAQDAQETDMYTQDANLSMIVEAAEEDITAEERLLEEQQCIEEGKADFVVLDEDLDVAEPVEERHLEEQLRIDEAKADCVVLDEDLDVAEPVEERLLEEQLRIDEAKADCVVLDEDLDVAKPVEERYLEEQLCIDEAKADFVVLDEDLDVAEPVEDSVTKIQTAIEDLKLETEASALGIDVGDLKAYTEGLGVDSYEFNVENEDNRDEIESVVEKENLDNSVEDTNTEEITNPLVTSASPELTSHSFSKLEEQILPGHIVHADPHEIQTVEEGRKLAAEEEEREIPEEPEAEPETKKVEPVNRVVEISSPVDIQVLEFEDKPLPGHIANADPAVVEALAKEEGDRNPVEVAAVAEMTGKNSGDLISSES